ncbi:unnamed protein product [Cyprideis torosa]|uniref:Uncharacterized protein n=1 Tax=Cyprideis torosa TaxID=163714 RepID=A0A7R8ZRU9_9CRUS|nr:unnamed protein product [Cyprideis torosa]CAG0894825.1 unnamed protein product [Cyprideis torosa]
MAFTMITMPNRSGDLGDVTGYLNENQYNFPTYTANGVIGDALFPSRGLLDDAVILGFGAKMILEELERFLDWEDKNSKDSENTIIHFKTEIISSDSRQLYREMTIGTAKPSIKEMQGVPHHFIHHLSIHEPYSAGKIDLETAASEIKKNSRRYAKRQLTWYRRYDSIFWIEAARMNEFKPEALDSLLT